MAIRGTEYIVGIKKSTINHVGRGALWHRSKLRSRLGVCIASAVPGSRFSWWTNLKEKLRCTVNVREPRSKPCLFKVQASRNLYHEFRYGGFLVCTPYCTRTYPRFTKLRQLIAGMLRLLHGKVSQIARKTVTGAP